MKYRSRIAPSWYVLGTRLLEGRYFRQVQVTHGNYPTDVESACSEMLKLWLDVDPKANWNKFINALEEIGHHALADQIRRDWTLANQIRQEVWEGKTK